MSDNMRIWNLGKEVPTTACKTITGGRLKGFTDIKPQWRYEKLTELFGACGVGWYVEIKRLWIEDGSKGEKTANADINLYFKDGDEWSKPVAGIGGASFIALQSGGLYTSDECYKMAVTDAISVCCKQMGIGADIYNGLPATKYPTIPEKKEKKSKNTELIEALKKISAKKGYTVADVEKKISSKLEVATAEILQKAVEYYAKADTRSTRELKTLSKNSTKTIIEIEKICQENFTKKYSELTDIEKTSLLNIIKGIKNEV